MSSIWSSNIFRRYLLSLTALLVLLSAGTAFAVGQVKWTTTTIKPLSDGNSWRLEMAIYLPSKPDFANLPVKFEFLPTVYFERSMVDGDKELIRDVPIEGRQPLVESVEVGFLDPGTGEIQKRTKFTFKLRRDRGYDAGKYRVTLKDGRNGNVLGQPTNITLEGQNELIDRRSMDFSAKPKEKKESADGDEAADKKEENKEDSSSSESAESSESDEPAAGTEDDEEYSEADDEPAGEIKEKPGGCGCRTAGMANHSSRPVAWLAAFAALGVVGIRRRRA